MEMQTSFNLYRPDHLIEKTSHSASHLFKAALKLFGQSRIIQTNSSKGSLMRSFFFFAVCIVFGGMLLTTLACPYSGPHYPVTYGLTPTPTAPPTASVTIVGSGTYTYSPSAVTIQHGGTVVFYDSTGIAGHTVHVDNGSGTCVTDPSVPANGSVALTAPFANIGTFYYHCDLHSPCGVATCGSSCTGMVGTVTAQ